MDKEDGKIKLISLGLLFLLFTLFGCAFSRLEAIDAATYKGNEFITFTATVDSVKTCVRGMEHYGAEIITIRYKNIPINIKTKTYWEYGWGAEKWRYVNKSQLLFEGDEVTIEGIYYPSIHSVRVLSWSKPGSPDKFFNTRFHLDYNYTRSEYDTLTVNKNDYYTLLGKVYNKTFAFIALSLDPENPQSQHYRKILDPWIHVEKSETITLAGLVKDEFWIDAVIFTSNGTSYRTGRASISKYKEDDFLNIYNPLDNCEEIRNQI